MHELTLAHNTVELLEQQARANQASKVTAVWLAIGAFSCVEEEALQFCFDLACRGSMAEGCILHLETEPAYAWCSACQQQVTLLHAPVRLCPQCGSYNLQTDASNSVRILRVELI